MVFAIDGHSRGLRAGFANAVTALAVAASAVLATPAMASVYYAFNVVAETGVGGFTGLGNGPSINDKGKIAFVSTSAGGPTVTLWSPIGGLSDLASTLLSPNRSFGDSVRINSNDEVLSWNRLLPLGLYEVRVFRSGTPNDSSIMVRGLSGGQPYDLLYQNPAMNSTRVLEDRSSFIATGNKDGVCDPGEVCVSQIAFNAFRSGPLRFLGTVVQNPTNAADVGVRNEFGLNTSQSRPMMADDGRVVVRGVNPTDAILLFSQGLGTQKTIAGSGSGFTALGAASGIAPDGKVVAFAGNRGRGDGIFLSLEGTAGQRRVVRIVGENATIPKAELGFDANGNKLFMQSIELDSRVGVAYTPDIDGVANKSVVVSFIGTPSAASRTNPGTGTPFLFSAQKGLWTIRIDLDAPLHDFICVTRAPGSGVLPTPGGDDQLVQIPGEPPIIDGGNNNTCETENDHASETLFSRSSPLPVVQIGDTIKSTTGLHTVSSISVNDPVAPANYDGALIPRTARNGDHRIVFQAIDSGGKQMIVGGSHLDSDQDGLLDHWETTGIDLDGTGSIDLDLAAMGANPFKRDFFIQVDWGVDRANDPLATRAKHQPGPGVLRKLAQFYAAAPATASGIPAGIQLHVDAGSGFDTSGQYFSRNMGIGPLRGGNIVSAPGSQPIDVLYFRTLGVINVPGVNAVDFDNLKTAVFWSSHRGAREFAFVHVVNADFHHAMGPGGGSNNATPIVGIATGGSSFTLEHQNGPLTFEMRGHAIKITAGTGAGQMRTIQGSYTYNATGIQFVQVDDPWVTPPDTTSQYIILHGSGGEGQAGTRYDGAFSPGKNLAITLAGYGRNPPGNHLGSFTDQWKTLAHEIGHLTSLMHGGRNHDNYKVNYVSLMNYAYENCVAPNVGRDSAGVNLPGAAACPINNYSLPTDLVSNDWHNLDLRSSLNFQVMGQAFGAPPDPPTSPSRDQPTGRTIKEVLDQNGPRDSQPPTVQITSPAGGAAFALGSTIPVSFTATDNVSVGNAEVLFDLNGDGSIDEATEVFPAVPGGGNTYTATLPAVSGPSGSRRVSVFAYDPAGNPGAAFVIVNVGSVAPGTIPGVVGQTEEDAIAAAESAVFTIGTITRQQSASVPAGLVISQTPPAGQSRPPGTVVILVISLGATGVIVPSVVGLSQSAATSAITGAGLTVGTVTQNASPAGPVASVLAQSPAGGAVAAGSTAVNLLVTSTIPTFTLDVDASVAATKYHAPTDGLLILRYLFGLAGTSLTNGALGVTATRTDPTVIKTYLDGNLTALDIDGNGKYDALTDGVLIVRYMLNLRGNALITGAFDPMGSRTTAFDIENHLLSLMPP